MNRQLLSKEDEENIINEGIFNISMNVLGRAIRNRVGVLAHATHKVAKKAWKGITSQDRSYPDYDPTQDENSDSFNPSNYNPNGQGPSVLNSILRKANEHNNPNSQNYRPSYNKLMMQQLNQQNSAQ